MMSNGKEITILVIDDDEFCREMAQMILEENFPYKILTAPSGMDGVDMLIKNTVHLILLDVAMPGWDGFKTLSVIRDNVLLKKIPVIMLTASADRDSIIKASQFGVDDYIRKPFEPENLVSRVSKAIWDHWQEESLDTLGSSLDDLLKDFGQD
jgi:DNA-binding response OmpR family regulator